MATSHICHVDCELIVYPTGAKAHMMHAAEPNSAAGRYQYDVNRGIYRMGKGARAAWRTSGQGQNRACRVWDAERRAVLDEFGVGTMHGIRRLSRALSPVHI